MPEVLDGPVPELSPAGERELDARWWDAFDDPVLDGLIDQALMGNLELHAAWARIDAAEASRRATRANALPSVDAYISSRVGTDDPFEGTRRVPFELGVQSSWEVDLWGRVRAQVAAQEARVEATRLDYEAAAISLSASVATTAWQLTAARERLDLLDQQLQANEQLQELTEARYDRGQLALAEVLQQRRLVEATRARQLDAAADVEVLEHQLAVLMGRVPQGASFPELPGLSAPPSLPATGLPLELIERRPDVQSAWQDVQAADAGVAAALRDRFPSLRLGGSVSNAPASVAAILEGWVASLATSLVAPIFDAGARKAEVRRTHAVLEQRVADYGSAVLTAFQEVEDALSAERRAGATVQSLEAQATLARDSAEQLEQRFAQGQATWLEVLQATTTAQSLERDVIDARLDALVVRVQLHRALAGPIPHDRSPPEESP